MLLVGIALVGGVGSGLANDSVGLHAIPLDRFGLLLPMEGTAELEEGGGARETDSRSSRQAGHTSSLWGEPNWRSYLGVTYPTPGRETPGGASSSVVLEVQGQPAGHGHGLAGVDEIRAYAYGAFQELGLDADYAWEVLRCESDRFDPDVIYGPRTGSSGEIGIGQLKPNGGLLEDFYDQGYQDPWDPFQQIDYISWKVSREGWWAWSCAR